MTYQTQREQICQVGKLLYDRGYVAANDGNISVLVDENRLLITPSGVSKGRMTPEMLLLTDLDGNVLEGDRHPSSEGKMHLEVYRQGEIHKITVIIEESIQSALPPQEEQQPQQEQQQGGGFFPWFPGFG